MATGKTTIRAATVLAMVTALGGCYSVRHRNDGDAVAAGQPPVRHGKKAKEPREVLPTGLAGDREHHAYTDTPN